MKKKSIIQPILDAIDETDGSIARHMNQLIKWAKYIEKEIGSLNGYAFKSELFTVIGSSIILPSDCYRVHKLFLGDFTETANLRYLDSCRHLELAVDRDSIRGRREPALGIR